MLFDSISAAAQGTQDTPAAHGLASRLRLRLRQRLGLATAATLLGLASLSPVAQAADSVKIFFGIHSSPSNTFWQAVKKGFDDACKRVDAQCQMVFTQTEGSVQQQLSNIEAGLARKPDVLLLTIVDAKVFAPVIAKARAAGVTVIAVNVDSEGGAKDTERQAYIGQGFVPAGHALGMALSKYFPKTGKVKALVGVSAPGQTWSEARAAGVIKFLEEYKAANPSRDVSWERMDSGTDLGITAERVGAKLNSDKDINVYFDTGFWDAGVARVLKDRGVAAGKVAIGGFDLVPEALQQIKDGYVQVHVDQQPYMQGFMGAMQGYLATTVKLSPSDIDTGRGLVERQDVQAVMPLAQKGLR